MSEQRCEGGDADACEILAARYFLGEGGTRDEPRGASLARRAASLRATACQAGDSAACTKVLARSSVVTAPPAAVFAVNMPRVGGGEQVFTLELSSAQGFSLNGVPVADEGALLAEARALQRRTPGARVVLSAEANVAYGRVFQALDVLKQAMIVDVAFGVMPAP